MRLGEFQPPDAPTNEELALTKENLFDAIVVLADKIQANEVPDEPKFFLVDRCTYRRFVRFCWPDLPARARGPRGRKRQIIALMGA